MTRSRGKILDFLSSYAFAIILLLLLLVLTWLGTIAQTELGLYEVQQRYFESIFFVQWVGKVPVLLPGVYLLLVLLTVNLVLGGILRMRRSWSRIGIYVTHAGILMLLVGSFYAHQKSIHGHMTLFEGDSSSEFLSHFDWEVAIRPVDAEAPVTEQIIGEDDLTDLEGGDFRRFVSPDLPFTLTIWNWLPNCRPSPVMPGHGHGRTAIGGFALESLPREKQAEANRAGAYAAVETEGEEGVTQGILWGEPAPPWGRQAYPFLATVKGKRWAIDLRKVRRNLPFTITLEEFHHEFHPGTRKPKIFRSVVTKTEEQGGKEVGQVVDIEMNEPLREKGYTVYQSNWGPQDAREGDRLFSGFSVVWNPADQWPLVCCIVIGIGLLMHFGRKLYLYLKAEAGRRS